MSNRAHDPFSLRTGRFPLLVPALCLGTGVFLADWLGYPQLKGSYGILILIFLISLFFLGRNVAGRRIRFLLGAFPLLLLLLTGYWRATDQHPINDDRHFVYALPSNNSPATLLTTIAELKPGDNSLRLIVEVEELITDSVTTATTGKLLVYLPPTEESASLKPGARIIVYGVPQPIGPPLNPYAFAADQYWARQGILHRIFLREPSSWRGVQDAKPSIYSRADALRTAWLNSFRPWLGANELAVASALILGKKDLLTDELRNAYADTGAVHVLAVSGLHVGIISLLLTTLLGWLPLKRRWWGYLKIILIISGIWGFALLTGLSASVIRASFMFTVIALGGLGARRSHLFNTLSLAALVILVVNPQQLFQVGFQLSFAAVAGIGLFQKWLENLFYIPSLFVTEIWSGISVGIAATLGTLPFTLFYFHQFPLYFMITGSIVVYSAFAILLAGILHGFICLIFSSLSGVTGSVLNAVVELQNGMVLLGQKLPGARQEIDWLSTTETSLLLLSIVLLGLWLRRRSFSILISAFLMLLGFAFFGYQSSKEIGRQQRIIVYQVRGNRVIDVIHGKQAVRLTDEVVDPEKLRYSVDNHVQARGYKVDTTVLLEKTSFPVEIPGVVTYVSPYIFTAAGVFQLDGISAGEIEPDLYITAATPTDFKPFINGENRTETVVSSEIIVDGKAYRNTSEKWAKTKPFHKAKIHLTASQGAWVWTGE